MGLGSKRDLTYPHDYRVVCAGIDPPTVVGGQAVILWAVSYLSPRAAEVLVDTYGSKDLDLLADHKVLEHLNRDLLAMTSPGTKGYNLAALVQLDAVNPDRQVVFSGTTSRRPDPFLLLRIPADLRMSHPRNCPSLASG